MGLWRKCEKCKKTSEYEDNILNIGTEWHQIWVMECPKCGSTETFDHGILKFFDRYQISREEGGGIVGRFTKRPDAHKRAESGNIKEYWIQEYVRENYKKLGFSEIEGPFEAGPDFRGRYKGESVVVEVERTCEEFVKHGHHKDPRFKNVSVLIVLSHVEPPADLKKELPETIIQIEVDDFVKYWRPKARAYAKSKTFEEIISLIAGEFKRRFIINCGSKDRDMSTCPMCDLCAYFDGEVERRSYRPDLSFYDLALFFLACYKYPNTSDNFKITDINPEDINEFYLDFYD